jgi:hypothetical protein
VAYREGGGVNVCEADVCAYKISLKGLADIRKMGVGGKLDSLDNSEYSVDGKKKKVTCGAFKYLN